MNTHSLVHLAVVHTDRRVPECEDLGIVAANVKTAAAVMSREYMQSNDWGWRKSKLEVERQYLRRRDRLGVGQQRRRNLDLSVSGSRRKHSVVDFLVEVA